jgi:hypothetical protein
MTFSRQHNPVKFSYLLGGDVIDHMNIIKYLCVAFDSALTFNGHISTLTRRTNPNLLKQPALEGWGLSCVTYGISTVLHKSSLHLA